MILALIQARQGSTRLPGKSMLTLAGKPLIEHVVNRVKDCNYINFRCVATTDQPEDDELAAHVATLGTDVFRGSATDVLSRFYWAAERYPQAEAIVRITADDYCKDPKLIDMAVELFLTEWADKRKGVEPPQLMHLGGPTWALGMDVEVMTRTALTAAYQNAVYSQEREHVTQWIARTMGVWVLKDPKSRTNISTRLTLDTLEDYSLALKLYDRLFAKSPLFGYDETLQALREMEVAA